MITTPTRSNDTLARYAVYALGILALWAGVRQLERPATSAQAQDIIILQATPTPALPTPAPNAPAFVLEAPTPIVVYVEVPGPTPPPDLVYVTVQAESADGLTPPIAPEPAYDPALHPDEAAAALAEAQQGLPTAGAPPDAAAEAASDAYQQRRLSSGAYRPRTR